MLGPSDPHRSAPRRRGSGRHRHLGSSLPGPLALGVLVAALLLALGVGAAMLRPALDDPLRASAAAGVRSSSASPQPIAPTRAAPASTAESTPGPTGVGSLGAAPVRVRQTAKPSPTLTGSGTRSRGQQRTAIELREDDVVALTNRERAKAGCGALRTDTRLHTAASAHSEDMAATNTMSHTGSDGSTPWDRAEAVGYTQAMAENVAVGYRTPADVVAAWLNSAGHRANMLNCDAKAIGVGLGYGRDGQPYWTQLFGRA
ncbi:MAG TPA: CAP domain-containing protein [Micromonosporaceae bacterium]